MLPVEIDHLFELFNAAWPILLYLFNPDIFLVFFLLPCLLLLLHHELDAIVGLHCQLLQPFQAQLYNMVNLLPQNLEVLPFVALSEFGP
jgi:hypothetical protein